MNRYLRYQASEFPNRQGCIFTDFHHEEVHGVQMLMCGRLPQNPIRRICRLRNRNGYFLTISESGRILGTKNSRDEFSKYIAIWFLNNGNDKLRNSHANNCCHCWLGTVSTCLAIASNNCSWTIVPKCDIKYLQTYFTFVDRCISVASKQKRSRTS